MMIRRKSERYMTRSTGLFAIEKKKSVKTKYSVRYICQAYVGWPWPIGHSFMDLVRGFRVGVMCHVSRATFKLPIKLRSAELTVIEIV